jgi:hypothetical protein
MAGRWMNGGLQLVCWRRLSEVRLLSGLIGIVRMSDIYSVPCQDRAAS